MLACARIGAVHSVVFGGFSPEALAGRINDCDSEFVVTADQGVRGGKGVPLKDNVDKALEQAPACGRAVRAPYRRAGELGGGPRSLAHELALKWTRNAIPSR
jgi:acyl-coenzyme A synthetase/AMP-(fatty) acid ligase